MTAAATPIESMRFADFEADPYPLYARLRTTQPLAYVPGLDEWLATTWEMCELLGAMGGEDGPIAAGHIGDDAFFGTPNILRIEGDEHRSLRGGIDVGLRPRAVRSMLEPIARPIVVDYVERIREQGSADLAADLFERISVRVVGTQLGLGDLDDATLVRWFQTLSGGISDRDGDDAMRAASDASKQQIEEDLRERVARLQREPDASIISHMLHGGRPDGHPRSYEQVAPSIQVIILGGFQEPGNAVANAFLGLLTHPEQLAALRDDPERLAAPAMQESFRWIAPIGAVSRTARRDVVVGAQTIPAGSAISLVVASANRDPQRFDDADAFDIARMLRPNATFGYGEHFCAGHFLARGLGEIMIQETASRLPGLRRHPEQEPLVTGYLFRGAKSLPALWDA